MKRFDITTYRWVDNDYRPKTYAELSLTEDTLTLSMTCEERDPLARYDYGPNAPVCDDSCMEFFFSLDEKKHYVNFEINAIGGYYCAYRQGRQDKVFHDDLFTENGKPKATIEEDFWRITVSFSVPKLLDLFGITRIESIFGNFYKCGEETSPPHFGMWAEIDVPSPDYHRPEFFQRIEL